MNKISARIREPQQGFKNRKLIRVGAITLLSLLLTCMLVVNSYSEDVNKGLADNLIRLHVLANSDSAQDQQLKRDVRDIVIAYMKPRLAQSRDLENTKYIIKSNMTNIEKLAREEILRQGKDYTVQVMLGSFPFPTKSYGDVTLPAGYYEALRVVIGKGEGANWWCVLFPPLCFVDATHGTVPDSVKQELKSALAEDEYNLITATDNEEDIPVKVKFKIVEIFESSKMKVASLFNRIFGAGN